MNKSVTYQSPMKYRLACILCGLGGVFSARAQAANAQPQLWIATLSNVVNLRLLGVPGTNYLIETSPDLVNWAALTNFTASSASNAIPPLPATNAAAAFYRASLAVQTTDLYINQSDPLFLSVRDTNGAIAEYFGTKDTNGAVTTLTAMRVKDAGGNLTTVLFDDQERPIQLFVDSGVSFHFDWLSTTSLVVNALAPGGVIGIQIPLVLSGSTNPASRAAVPGIPATIGALKPHSLKGPSPVPNYSVSLTLTQCGRPLTDANVTVSVGGGILPMNSLQATRYGNLYSANIPNPYGPTKTDLCTDVSQFFGGQCNNPADKLASQESQDEICEAVDKIVESLPQGTYVGDAGELLKLGCAGLHALSYLTELCNGDLCDAIDHYVDRGKQFLATSKISVEIDVFPAEGFPEHYTFNDLDATSPGFGFAEDLPGAGAFELTGQNPPSINVGATASITAVPKCPGDTLALTWQSADQKIATVDSQGLVTGVSPGSTTILATGTAPSGSTIQRMIPITVRTSTPMITSVSHIAPEQTQTIIISGSGFGTQAPFNGDSDFLYILDVTGNWEAGYLPPGNLVTLDVSSWTDNQIVVSGFTGSYGDWSQQFNWTLQPGNDLTFAVWNPQTGAGPATYKISINSP